MHGSRAAQSDLVRGQSWTFTRVACGRPNAPAVATMSPSFMPSALISIRPVFLDARLDGLARGLVALDQRDHAVAVLIRHDGLARDREHVLVLLGDDPHADRQAGTQARHLAGSATTTITAPVFGSTCGLTNETLPMIGSPPLGRVGRREHDLHGQADPVRGQLLGGYVHVDHEPVRRDQLHQRSASGPRSHPG